MLSFLGSVIDSCCMFVLYMLQSYQSTSIVNLTNIEFKGRVEYIILSNALFRNIGISEKLKEKRLYLGERIIVIFFN